jgi:DNA modification methylase
VRRQNAESGVHIESALDAVPAHVAPVSNSQRLSGVVCGDARELVKQLKGDSVDVTVTSPPYFDLKDYGSPQQLGFGQKYEDYLQDLSSLFEQIYRATKEEGSLWIVIDTFRKNHEVRLLPFDLADKLKSVGWVLRDIIIWKKDRTLPWLHKGTTRRIFEYVLVFAKSSGTYQYFPDEEREFQDLKSWWVQYPERYSPKGKALEEIWNFDIPTQGSWGDPALSHACPLPPQLVSRIIRLTTTTGQLVLDPFSGTGTVPVQARSLGRAYLAFDTNSKYVEAARKRILELPAPKDGKAPSSVTSKDFRSTIIALRILKLAKLLLRDTRKYKPELKAARVLVKKQTGKPAAGHKIVRAEYLVVVQVEAQKRKALQSHLRDRMSKPPHSKFGVEATLEVVSSAVAIKRAGNAKYYQYSATAPYKTHGQGDVRRALTVIYPIASTIRVDEEVPSA